MVVDDWDWENEGVDVCVRLVVGIIVGLDVRVMEADKLGVICKDKLRVTDGEEDILALMLVDNVFDVVNVIVGNTVDVVLIDPVVLVVPVIVFDSLFVNDKLSLLVTLALIDVLVEPVDVML